MKNSFIYAIWLIILVPTFVFCQAKKESAEKTKLTSVYLDFGTGRSNGSLAGVGLNFILSNNFGGSFGFNKLVTEAKELPNDYKPGSFFGHSNGNPNDEIESFSIRFLKEFPTDSKKIRFGLEGGPAFVKYTAKEFTPSESRPFSIFFITGVTSNYQVTTTLKNTLGASFRAKMEFPLARWIGFELALHSNLNIYRSFLGAEIHMTVGLVRGKIEMQNHVRA